MDEVDGCSVVMTMLVFTHSFLNILLVGVYVCMLLNSETIAIFTQICCGGCHVVRWGSYNAMPYALLYTS